jgi:MoaA/NifB/PqqE/SkfB family radical SAM enzyme
LSFASWGKRLFRSAFRDRTPISGSIALTHRCNLECVHCYLEGSRDGSELDAGAWIDILDQLERAGCLWLTITGGEPLLAEAFEEVYLHAKKKGFLVIVFTNGTLVDGSVLEMFSRWPPHCVEISLYGSTARTTGAVTGNPAAHGAAWSAARSLAQGSVPLRLKTVALRHNAHEIEDMRRLSEELGAPFRFDPLITPCLDGAPGPCSARLDDESVVRLDVGDERRREAWRDCLTDEQRAPRRTLFTCGAGRTSFHVHPDGQLSLCLADVPLFDLGSGSFLEGWNGAIRERRDAALPADHPCMGCRDQAFCGVCAPLARMETGSDLGLAERLCVTGRRRLREIEGRP